MRKSLWVIIIFGSIIGVLSRIPPSLLISDQTLMMKVNAPLERILKKYGLTFKVENIRWENWDKFIITELQVMNNDEGIMPLALDKAELKINLWTLMVHPGNPEAVLKEVTLVNPQIRIERYQDGSWDFQKYASTSSSGRQMRLKTTVRVTDGRVRWKDAKYGEHTARGVEGKVDLGRYPEVAWRLRGKMDDAPDLRWDSQGKADIRQRIGLTEIDFRGLPLEQLVPFLPSTHSYQIRSGAAKGVLEVAWGEKELWVRDGQVRLDEAVVSLPGFSEDFKVSRLVADFSPERIFLKESRILYQKALLTASGMIDSQNGDLEMKVAGENLPLTDIAFYYPQVKKYGLEGLLDLRLNLGGTVNHPALNGEAILRKGRLVLAQLPIEDISGEFTVKDNDLRVTRLEGRYGRARLGISGQVKDVFNPHYALKVDGKKLELAQLSQSFSKVALNNLGTDSTADFTGKLTGDWQHPVFSGKVLADRLSYQEYPFENVDLEFSWDIAKRKLHVKKLEAGFHDGQAVVEGNIFIDSEQASWDLMGNLNRVNLAKSSYGKHNDLGGLISAEVILRGAWKKGEPFLIGPLFGTVRGEELSYREFSADKAQAVYRWEKNRFYLESLQMNIGEGSVFGNLVFYDRQLSLNLSLDDIELKKLLKHRTDLPAAGVFKGSIVVEGSLDDLGGRMVGEVKQASWLSRRLGDIRGEVDYHQGAVNLSSLALHTEAGDVVATGKMELGEEGQIQLAVEGEDIQIRKLAACFPETADLDLHGNGRLKVDIGGKVTSPKYRGLIELDRPGFKELVMEQGRLEFEGDLTKIHIRELQLADQASNLTMSGMIDKAGGLDLSYQGHFDDLKKLGIYYRGNVVAGLADFSGKLSGPLKAPVMTMSMEGSDISFGHFVNQGLEAQVVLKYPVLEIENFKLDGEGNSVGILGAVRFSLPMQLDLELNVVALKVRELLSTFNIQSLASDGELTGIIKLGGTVADPTMTVDGSLSNGLINNLEVVGDLELYYSQHNMYIQKIELKHGTGTFFVNGIWEDEKALKLKALLLNFPLQAVNDIIDSPIRLEGTTNADIRLEWSDTGIIGDYRSETKGLIMNDSRLGDVTLSGEYSKAGMSIVEGQIIADGGQIQVNGYIPWDEQLVAKLELPGDYPLRHELDLSMSVQTFPAEVANFMPTTFSLANGRLDGRLQLGGTLKNPVLSGKLNGNNVRLTLPAVPLEVNNVQSTINIADNHVVIETFSGNIDKGKVVLSGRAELEKLRLSQYSLDIDGSGIYYKNNFFDGYGNLDMNISGDPKRTLFAGELFVYETKISISAGESPVESEWRPEFDLVVKTGKNVRYRQTGIADVTVQGELGIKGTMLRPELTGRINAKKGVVTLYGQSFIVQRGMAIFKPENEFLPYLDVISSYMTNKAEILLSAKGQVGTDLAIGLDSQPHLPQSEIYALLNWSDLNGEQPMTVDGVIGSNLSFITDSLFGDFFYEVRNTLHIDYFYLETNYVENELRINMGDYVTDDLFVSFSRSVNSTEPRQTWGFDYHLNSRLVLGNRYSVEDGTNWRLTYGFRFSK